jgi:hypothetical protein
MTRDPYPFSDLSVNQKDEGRCIVHTPVERCVDLTSLYTYSQINYAQNMTVILGVSGNFFTGPWWIAIRSTRKCD